MHLHSLRPLALSLSAIAASALVAPASAQQAGACTYRNAGGSASMQCKPAVFEPPQQPLTFTAAGRYPHQLLGTFRQPDNGVLTRNGDPSFPLSSPSIADTLAARLLTPGADTFLQAANIVISPQAPDNSIDYTHNRRYVYADLTVSLPPTALSGVALVQLFIADAQSSTALQVATGFDALQLASAPAAGQPGTLPGCATPVGPGVALSSTKPTNLIGTPFWTSVVTLQNNTATAVAGALVLALPSLSPNAQIFGAAGTGTCPALAGQPFVPVPGSLAPGASTRVTLTFTNSQIPTSTITFTPTVVSGGSTL